VNTGIPAEFVALPIAPVDMIMGLVPLPAAHEGTTTPERVTITSAGIPVGQAGLMVMVEVAFCLGEVLEREEQEEGRLTYAAATATKAETAVMVNFIVAVELDSVE
jgi:hypothetical protein